MALIRAPLLQANQCSRQQPTAGDHAYLRIHNDLWSVFVLEWCRQVPGTLKTQKCGHRWTQWRIGLIRAIPHYCQQSNAVVNDSQRAITHISASTMIYGPFLCCNGAARSQAHLKLHSAIIGKPNGEWHESVRFPTIANKPMRSSATHQRRSRISSHPQRLMDHFCVAMVPPGPRHT